MYKLLHCMDACTKTIKKYENEKMQLAIVSLNRIIL